jgi:hypothetical protein
MALPTLYRTGYQWIRSSTSPSNAITVYPGNCRSDDDTEDIVRSSILTKGLDATWAVGNNAGGLDTGTLNTNTWYFGWAIKRTDTGVTDMLHSASPSSPTLPTNYSKKRLVVALRLNKGVRTIYLPASSAGHADV